ncbi:MAG: hypothetical protein HQL33_08490 [Alphaproteobacteria bacterium]|nr:hypothetical protein [Alphaproteobacteria bacterium]MBF0130018.1 hypothetical protein [Alphaproteobacteria bacterium]
MVSHFIRRWLACLFLVFATYNPSRFSYFHWATGTDALSWGFASTGVILTGAYLLGFQVLLSSIGWRGVLAGSVIAVCACLEVIRLRPDVGQLQWIIETVLLVVVSTTLAAGVSWSFLTTKLTGQKNKRYLNKGKKGLSMP